MNASWPHGDPRAVVKAVLSDRRYHAAPQTAAPKSLWDLFWDAVRAWWEKLMSPLGHMLGNNAATELIGMLVLGAMLIVLGLVIVRFLAPLVRERRALASRAEAAALAHDGDAAALQARARNAASAGRYREAAALLWASALRALDERGRVRFDAARTPGEWRRMLSDPAFDSLARDAVVALFGDRAVDAALFARMTTAYDAVVGAR